MAERPLRPYQLEAIDAITTALADGSSGQLHAACGSGKTIMAMRAAEQLTGPDGLIVVLAPSLGLVAQILGDWKADSSITYQRFAVCSDETVAGKNDDTAAVHTDELGVPVSTDRDQIAKWLTAEGPRLIVGTYLSANHLAAAARRAGRELDMLICDEAHHLAGNADAHTRRIMSPDALPTRRRLYVTATPRNGRGRDDEQHDTRTLSMDDEATFGPVLYSYPFSRGIAEGYLADYRIAVIGVTDREVRALLNRDDIEYVEGIGLRTAAAQVALARAYRDFGMRRAITFHGSVADAQRFVETLPTTLASLPQESSAPAPICLHANGAMDSEQRHAVLESLKNVSEDGWAVCSNVRCLSEGVDVPALDGVLFGNPKRSTVDIVQAASRALRLHPDVPGLSTIIVPVIVPDEGEADAIDPGAYEALFQILRALKEHDDMLSAELNAARAELGDDQTHVGLAEPNGGGDGYAEPHSADGINSADGFDGPVLARSTSGALSKIEFHGIAPSTLANLRLVILRQVTSAWWESFAKAQAYFRREGHLQPGGHDPLRRWLTQQRYQRSIGDLANEQVAALDCIGMDWDGRRSIWDRMYEAAIEHASTAGNLDVPQAFVTADGLKLGAWLTGQRSLAREGKLSERHRSQLDALGMSWEPLEDLWACGLRSLQGFRAEHGHVDVPQRYERDGFNLGTWLNTVRSKRRKGKLSAARAAELDELGIDWEPRKTRWSKGYEAAKLFYEQHGHLNVPQQSGFLGHWLNGQRQKLASGSLSDDRKRQLDAIGMEWSPRDGLWRVGIEAARAYRAASGHLNPPQHLVVDGFPLGAWLATRRLEWRRGVLLPERRRELDRLGIAWDPAEERWRAGLQKAVEFHASHGHLRVPQGYIVDGFALGRWIANCRTRAESLSPQRKAALDQLGMAWRLRQATATTTAEVQS